MPGRAIRRIFVFSWLEQRSRPGHPINGLDQRVDTFGRNGGTKAAGIQFHAFIALSTSPAHRHAKGRHIGERVFATVGLAPVAVAHLVDARGAQRLGDLRQAISVEPRFDRAARAAEGRAGMTYPSVGMDGDLEDGTVEQAGRLLHHERLEFRERPARLGTGGQLQCRNDD